MNLPRIGDVIGGKHRIEEVLGEGGYGRVYRGTTDLSGRPVAIKVLKPGRQGYDLKRTQRFFRELRAIAKLQSPYTLTLFDYGKTDAGILYMVTEFVDGRDLTDILAERGTLSERETAHLLMQLLQSLEEAHDAGVLHRDIKPSNIRIFSYHGDPLRAKLLDFGLARSLRVEEARLTATGMVVGTPRYMSPEQILGQELTPASDIFSLGLVALDCVQGRTPERQTELPPGADVSPRFREVLNQMLARDPAARFRNAREAYETLRGVRRPSPRSQPEPQQRAAPASRPMREEPRVAPKAWPLAGCLMTVVLLFVATVWIAGPEPTPTSPPRVVVDPGALLRGSAAPPSEGQPSPAPQPSATPERADGCGVQPSLLGEVVVSTKQLVRGNERASVYLPTSYDAAQRQPLIVVFHDFPGGPWGAIRRSGLDKLANEQGVVLVAVADKITGMGGIWSSQEDTKRVDRAVMQVKQNFCIDGSRIFAFGHGVGGRGVERLMCESDYVAAGATTSYRPHVTGEVRCQRAKPRLQIDPQNSGSLPTDGNTKCRMFDEPVLSTASYEQELRGRAACTGSPSVWMKHAEGTCRTWTCETPLVTCRVRGGREFPDTAPRQGLGVTPRCDGEPGNFPYTEAIWRFFAETAAAAPDEPE